MQELKLVSIEGYAEGGSTKPLFITAVNNDGVVDQYVMKIFKYDNIEQNYSVAKEIFINELAKEFNLSVPDYALINIDNNTLSQYYTNDQLRQFDNGYKFCSKFMAQYVIFDPIVSLSFIKDYDIENLFCFDNIILNSDRGGYRNKPNLLVNDKEILLIDHELTLPFINYENKDANYYNYIRTYQYEKHILTKHIQALRFKDSLFIEFFESLKYINISKFNKIFDELDKYKVKYGDRNKIFAYLNWIKTNITFLSNQLLIRIK